MLKKITILIITCLFAVTSLTGCAYWEGYSKNQCVQLVEDALEEKYGEDFVVDTLHTGSGGWYGVAGPLVATCYSKNDDTLFFEAEYNKFGDVGELKDEYIHEIVAKQIKSVMRSVLVKYYDKFAVEIELYGLVKSRDPEITDSANATIENFSKALNKEDKDMHCNGWIVLDESQLEKYSQEEIETIINEIGNDLHLMSIGIDFCYVNDELLEESIAITKDETNDSRDIEKIIELDHKAFRYFYSGQDKTITRLKPMMG